MAWDLQLLAEDDSKDFWTVDNYNMRTGRPAEAAGVAHLEHLLSTEDAQRGPK